jgi:hypothetical protein
MNNPTHPVSKAICPVIAGACRHRDVLKFDEVHNDSGARLSITPHRADFPVLLGKKKRQFLAFNMLFESASLRRGECGKLRLNEGTVGQPEFERFNFNPGFDVHGTRELLETLLAMLFDKPPTMKIDRGSDPEKLFVNLWFGNDDPYNTMIAQALNDAFYPYGYRQGIRLRINAHLPNGSAKE